MSMFYLVHKDDALTYDSLQKQRLLINKEMKALLEREGIPEDCNCQPGIHERDPLDHFMPRFIHKFEQIHSIEKSLKIIKAFDPKPKDTENYYVYYRGMRWGEAKGSEATNMQDSAIIRMKKILGG